MTSPSKREDLLRSALLMTGATYVNYGTGILISLIIARSLGPTQYGQYAYLVWLSGILVLLYNNGLATTAITFISQRLGAGDVQGAAAVHGWLYRLRKYGLIVVSLAFLVTLPFIKPSGWQDQVWLFAALVLFSATTKASYGIGISVAKGYGQFSVEAIISNTLSVLSLVCVLIAAWLDAGVAAYIGIFVFLCVAHALFSLYLLRKAHIRPANATLTTDVSTRIRTHLGWTTVLILVAVFSSKTIETFLLNAWAGSEAVGFFLIAVALTKGGIELLSSGLNSVLMSHMAHAYGSDGEAAVNRVLANNVRYFHFLGLMLAGVGYFWAPAVIALMYGDKYLPVIPALQILIVAGGFALTEGVFGARLSTTGSQKTRALIVMATLIFSAVMALSLVPTYGLRGAAISSALTTVLGFIVIAIYTVTRSSVHLPYASIIQMMVIAFAVAVASFALTLWNPGVIAHVIAGIAFAVAYVVASLFTKIWTLEDLRGVSRLTQKVPGLRNRNLNLERWARKS